MQPKPQRTDLYEVCEVAKESAGARSVHVCKRMEQQQLGCVASDRLACTLHCNWQAEERNPCACSSAPPTPPGQIPTGCLLIVLALPSVVPVFVGHPELVIPAAHRGAARAPGSFGRHGGKLAGKSRYTRHAPQRSTTQRAVEVVSSPEDTHVVSCKGYTPITLSRCTPCIVRHVGCYALAQHSGEGIAQRPFRRRLRQRQRGTHAAAAACPVLEESAEKPCDLGSRAKASAPHGVCCCQLGPAQESQTLRQLASFQVADAVLPCRLRPCQTEMCSGIPMKSKVPTWQASRMQSSSSQLLSSAAACCAWEK